MREVAGMGHREMEEGKSRNLTGSKTDGVEGMVKWGEDKNPEVR